MPNTLIIEQYQEFLEFFSKLGSPPINQTKYEEGINTLKQRYTSGGKYDTIMSLLKCFTDYKGNKWELIDFLDDESYYKLSTDGQIFYNKGGFIGEAKRKQRKEFWDLFTAKTVVLIAVLSFIVNVLMILWNINTTKK